MKQSGLGMRFLVGGYDISGDIQALGNVRGGPAPIDVTDITQEARSRIGGLRDGELEAAVYFDTTNAHPVLSALPVADAQMMMLVNPLAVGSAAACLNAKQVGYDPTRGADGSLLLKVAGQGSGFGLEWGQQLTPGVRADSAATSGASLDGGAATSFGGQAYLQLTAFAGVDVTVKIQHSADNATWADLLTFAQVTAAPSAQRLALANTATVDRYLRAVSVTTGGFTSASFAVVFCRNPVAGVSF